MVLGMKIMIMMRFPLTRATLQVVALQSVISWVFFFLLADLKTGMCSFKEYDLPGYKTREFPDRTEIYREGKNNSHY